MKKALFIFTLFNFIFINQMVSHGDIHKRIIEVTKEIKVSPDSAYLYVKRGKFYFQHKSYKKSIDDLQKSKTLGYQSVEQKLLFAKGYNSLKAYEKALPYCDEILSNNPKNVRAIKVKAQAYLGQGDFYAAALDFENVINYSNKSFPENYIDASHAWELLDNDEGYKKGTIIIHKGIENLGHLISLYSRLIELAVKQGDYNSAIESQLLILNLSPRKETAYYKLSELYCLNGNAKKALEFLNLAKVHFNILPERLQNTAFMKQLIENIKSKETLLINN